MCPADLVIKNVRILDIVGGQLTSATAGEEGPGGAPRPQQRLPPPGLVDFARQGPDRDAAISSGWTVA